MNIKGIIIAILIFSLIIIFHELGHFLFAKLNNIRVNEFSLGLGPTLVGFTKGETKYCLKLLPFGGACVMEGEDGDSKDDRAFVNKSVWARISVVAAGPIFNFIMAFVISIIVVAMVGADKPVIGNVMNGLGAESAGLQAGDVILKLNNKKINVFRELTFYTYTHEGQDIDVTYSRNGVKNTVTIKPTYIENEDRYLIGIQSSGYSKCNFFQVLKYSAVEVKYYIDTTLTSLKLLITGQVSVKEMQGPVGIVSTISETYSETINDTANEPKSSRAKYVFLNLASLCILLSANLGVMNLLPIPALDGGRLFFMIVELIRRKKIDPEKEGKVHLLGLILLLILMVFVMFNDIRKLIGF